MVTLFIVGGGLIYLDKAENGGFAAYEDGFSILELCRKHYRQAGLDVRHLDLLVRQLRTWLGNRVMADVITTSASQLPE